MRSKIYWPMLVVLMMLSITVTTASAGVIVKTDKYTYNKGDIITITVKNNNNYMIYLPVRGVLDWDLKNIVTRRIVYQSNDGCLDCVYIDDPITVDPWKSYTWTWDQKVPAACVALEGITCPPEIQIGSGWYKIIIGDYKSNIFRIR